MDTIDTLGSGIPNAIRVFEELRRRGHAPVGIRLDSGDLAHLSIRAAKMLDDAGFLEASIVLSNDLDELIIMQIITQIAHEAPRYGVEPDQLIGRLTYGVGTRLITSWGEPALGGVYKLVAVRDEGTSYHYLPPGREVEASSAAVAAIEQTLKARGVDYLLGKTWTTDAPYRETPAKVQLRRAEGCLTVEMEAATFFAVAQFRGVQFGQLLYGGDDVSSEEWDARDWNRKTSVREALFWLAVESCLGL